MNAITELARRLGKAIAESQQAAALRVARGELDKEPDLKNVLEDYRQQSLKVAELQEDNKPIEVEDKHSLQELHDKLVSSPIFKKFTAAQVEYVDLMRKVNDAMQKELTDTEES